MGPSTYHLALSSSLRKYSSNTHSRKECCGFGPWEDELPGMFSSVLLNSFDLPRIACRLLPQNNYIYTLKRNYFGKEIIAKGLVLQTAVCVDKTMLQIVFKQNLFFFFFSNEGKWLVLNSNWYFSNDHSKPVLLQILPFIRTQRINVKIMWKKQVTKIEICFYGLST